MNLARKPPLGIKAPPSGSEPRYLARVRELPCVICHEWGMPQQSPTQAHHCIHGRYSARKRPDRMAIPLCAAHHLTGEKGYVAVHREPKLWKELYGEDVRWIAWVEERV